MEAKIVPVGKVEESILQRLSSRINDNFPLTLDNFKKIDSVEPSDNAYDPDREQYRGSSILNHLLSEVSIEEGKIIAITEADLYTSGLNFVFGQAHCPGKIALVSLHRLRPEFYGSEENEEIYLTRANKESIHELGHTFGLKHCAKPRCVMHFSNSIVEVDEKGTSFCDDCREKLNHATGTGRSIP